MIQTEKEGKGVWTPLEDARLYDLIAALGDRTEHLRRVHAAEVLGSASDPRAVTALVNALRDEHPDIRRLSARALREIGSIRSVEPLIDRMSDPEEKWKTRICAAEALGRIGTSSAIDGLVARLRDPSENLETRIAVATILGRTRSPAAEGALRECLRDPDPRVRNAAEKVLGMEGRE
ncbi:MAG: HEAT repeat domain-containing protein [Methanomicrobiales archaeon]|nr:HEAT repeat domain-containing protein [Methanomicrobiales archaeon]